MITKFKIYEGQFNPKFKVDDIVIRSIIDDFEPKNPFPYFVTKKFEGFGKVYWYDIESIFNNQLGGKSTIRSIEENKLKKLTPEKEAELRRKLEIEKYNL